MNALGLVMPCQIDESKISFPSENYDSAEVNQEAGGFWAAQRARLIVEMLSKENVDIIWEVGAGNGNAAIPIRGLGVDVLPIEPLKSGAITLHKNGFTTFHSTLEGLKLPANSINAIGAFDVLEHLENPNLLLSEVFRVLKPGGIFICSVPAYQWLFSEFDESIGHYRRYSEKLIEETLFRAGFKPNSTKYLFGFLVPVAFVLRKLIPFFQSQRVNSGSCKPPGGSSSFLFNKLSPLLGFLIDFEKKLNLKLGLSIFCLVVKPIS